MNAMRRTLLVALIIATCTTLLVGPAEAKTKPRPLNGFSMCADAQGDGAGGDLTKVTLSADKKTLQVGWETVEPLAGTESDSRVVAISGPKGKPSFQIGLKRVGSEIFRFVFNFSTVKQKNLTSAYTIDDTRSTFVVPLTALPGIMNNATWSAAITFDGRDADLCPDGSGKIAFSSST